jgi:hypothetical protein
MKPGLIVGSLLLAIALLAMASALNAAENQEEVANPDLKCLKCHSKNLKKSLEDGDKMSLHIDGADFAASVHNVIGCTGCHRDVPKGKHPSKQPVASLRAYSVERNETCSQCHEDHYEDYKGSIHASLVAEGNVNAPVCSDCHGAHSIQPRTDFEPVNGEPCSKCHEDIYQAYANSVHGHARTGGNEIRGKFVKAPVCSDCHQAHKIMAVADADYLVPVCTDCHEVAKLAHEQWLPNAAMHLKSVGCAVCHAPLAELRVNLQLYDRVQGTPVKQSVSNLTVQQTLEEIDTDGDGLDPVELWKLMLHVDEKEPANNIILRGRLEVASGVDAHRLAASTEAIRSCENCHQGNAQAFQNVTVSINRPDGRKETYKASNKVLNSPISVDSVGGFYAPGGTRIKLLDVLLVLALVLGLAVPVGHWALGKYLRKKKTGVK